MCIRDSLECDPPDECPPTDTQTLSSGGKSKDESNEKVNPNNIVDKVTDGGTFDASGNYIPPGFENAIRTDQIGGVTPTFDTSDLTEGSLIPESLTGGSLIPESLIEGSLIPESIDSGLDFLPEGLNLTPKKKFNIPKTEINGEEFLTISFDELDGEGEIDFFNQGDQ